MTRRGRARPAIEPTSGWLGVLLALSCGGGPGSAPSGEVGQSSGADACGMLERACCSAPRFACARGLWCDDATGLCREGASDSPGAALLCQTDADCAPSRRCCSAGTWGSCQALEAGAACAQPDVGVFWSGDGVTVEQEVFDGVTPSAGGCVREPGVRLRLRVSVAVANFGAADFIIGGRDVPLSGAARARDEFLVYSLIDASGEAVATSRGPLPCSDGGDPLQRFDCDFAGLAAGALMPARGLECEALDVTGLPAGAYRVRVALAHAWADADPSNDQLEMPLELPSFDPLDACPSVASPLLGSSFERECGWSRVSAPGAGTCRPGELVSLDCGGCQGTPILRLCAGDNDCRARSALGFASVDCATPDGDLEGPCATVQGTCPAGGRYSVLLGSEHPAVEASCTLTITPGF